MTLTEPARTSTTPRPALLLVLTLPAFVVYVAVALATVATKADSSSGELTPADLSDLGASWMVLHVLWMVPSVLAILGLARLAARVGGPTGTVLPRLVVVTFVLAAAYLVPQALAYAVDTVTWGESRWYAVGVVLSLLVGWLGTIPATVLVTLGLARQGVVPRTARTITVLCGLYLLWEVLTYATIALGSPTLVDTVGPPPFLLGVLWAVLGARLWWSGRRAEAPA